ncbi:MAG: hypothetical protein HC846_05045 [Blastocatellia bacterium]|nr:hypothetical protein [Blastocatellia bacterium]
MKDVRFIIVLLFLLSFAAVSISAQSTNVEFPTPITSDTISGKIKARDIGDPRSTIYYYVLKQLKAMCFSKLKLQT